MAPVQSAVLTTVKLRKLAILHHPEPLYGRMPALDGIFFGDCLARSIFVIERKKRCGRGRDDTAFNGFDREELPERTGFLVGTSERPFRTAVFTHHAVALSDQQQVVAREQSVGRYEPHGPREIGHVFGQEALFLNDALHAEQHFAQRLETGRVSGPGNGLAARNADFGTTILPFRHVNEVAFGESGGEGSRPIVARFVCGVVGKYDPLGTQGFGRGKQEYRDDKAFHNQ